MFWQLRSFTPAAVLIRRGGIGVSLFVKSAPPPGVAPGPSAPHPLCVHCSRPSFAQRRPMAQGRRGKARPTLLGRARPRGPDWARTGRRPTTGSEWTLRGGNRRAALTGVGAGSTGLGSKREPYTDRLFVGRQGHQRSHGRVILGGVWRKLPHGLGRGGIEQ